MSFSRMAPLLDREGVLRVESEHTAQGRASSHTDRAASLARCLFGRRYAATIDRHEAPAGLSVSARLRGVDGSVRFLSASNRLATVDRARYQSRTTSDGCRRRPHSGTDANPSTGASLLADRKSTRLNSSHLGISYAVF